MSDRAPSERLELVARQLECMAVGARGRSSGSLPGELDRLAAEVRGALAEIGQPGCSVAELEKAGVDFRHPMHWPLKVGARPFVAEAMQWRPRDQGTAGAMLGWLSGLGLSHRCTDGIGWNTRLQVDPCPPIPPYHWVVFDRAENLVAALSPEDFAYQVRIYNLRTTTAS